MALLGPTLRSLKSLRTGKVAAVMALKCQCKGKTLVKTRKNAASLSIRQSNYHAGACKPFTFAL